MYKIPASKDENKSNQYFTIPMSTPANNAGMKLKTVEDYGRLKDMDSDYVKEARKQPNLYNYSYYGVNTSK